MAVRRSTHNRELVRLTRERELIQQARANWERAGWADTADGMVAVISVMRAHQILLARADAALRPFGLTFSRFELLRLLAFIPEGALPISEASEQLQVHVTTVANTIGRLQRASLVVRQPHPTDGRTTLVRITELGRETAEAATAALNKEVFADVGMSVEEMHGLVSAINALRRNAGGHTTSHPDAEPSVDTSSPTSLSGASQAEGVGGSNFVTTPEAGADTAQSSVRADIAPTARDEARTDGLLAEKGIQDTALIDRGRLSRAIRLPVAPSFVGRTSQLEELEAMVRTSRLVSVVGVGGVGKTSLALQAAHRIAPTIPDGTWWIELADIHDGSLITDIVAAKLGVRDDRPGRQLTDVLVEMLAGCHALLVLDNCEHIINDVATFTETLLRSCPQLKILATSREVLRVRDESVLALHPMTYPRTNETNNLHLGTTDLATYDAVEFFVTRARNALPGFTLTEHNATLVTQICARLDGLPLAIELATARLRAMSLEAIAERLLDRFTLLTRGRRDAPTRQQTLTWCIEWSYDRCTPAEQLLWRRLSVFAGTFDIDAAHNICGHNLHHPTPEHDTPEHDKPDYDKPDYDTPDYDNFLDHICSLVDKSIIVRTEHSGTVRFRILETLREFGARRLTSTDTPHAHLQLRRRHLTWYQNQVASAAAQWFTAQQIHWLNQLTSDVFNIREAIQFALDDSPSDALQLTANMSRYWVARAISLRAARTWLDRALNANPPTPTPERIAALSAAVTIAFWQGDAPYATIRVHEARELLPAITNAHTVALVEHADGLASLLRIDLSHAMKCFERALANPPNPVAQAEAMLCLSWVFDAMGDTDQALSFRQKTLALAESHHETMNRILALGGITNAYWRKGDQERAEHYNSEGLRLALLTNYRRMGSMFIEGAAWIAEADGQLHRAAALMGAAKAFSAIAGVALPPYTTMRETHDACEKRLRFQLGSAGFESAWREGCAMTFEQAGTYALTNTKN